ncbi:MAG: BMP family ABC transporter substrate-binding protein [Treponema sp.]|nr:BMP family ABC transporter substrate-binding protein [Treponema sp.]
MKKVAICMTAVLALLCANNAFAGGGKQQQAGETYELALITNLGTIDDKSFNQGSWEGLTQAARERNATHKYYQSAEQSDDMYLSTIDLAVRGGAKVIVTPGFQFEVPIFIAQDRYPNVHFILVDGAPHDTSYSTFRTGPNTVGILYAEDQAGFLAGYAAVKDGYRSLGFVGGVAVPAVVRFGYGFIQGAEYAAKELGLAPGAVTVNYHYTGAFAATPEAQTLASSWYNQGVEVIFGCGGMVGNSVMAAAEQTGKKSIGVDVDQSGESSSIITSAMKGLQVSVYDSISDYYNNRFPGGQTKVFEAANKGVGLPMATSKFRTFKQADYDAIFSELASGRIPRMPDDPDAAGSPGVVPVTITRVTEVK